MTNRTLKHLETQPFNLHWHAEQSHHIVHGYIAVCNVVRWSVGTLTVKMSKGHGVATRTMINPDTGQEDILTITRLNFTTLEKEALKRREPRIVKVKKHIPKHLWEFDIEWESGERQKVTGWDNACALCVIAPSTLNVYIPRDGTSISIWGRHPKRGREKMLIAKQVAPVVEELINRPGRPVKDKDIDTLGTESQLDVKYQNKRRRKRPPTSSKKRKT